MYMEIIVLKDTRIYQNNLLYCSKKQMHAKQFKYWNSCSELNFDCEHVLVTVRYKIKTKKWSKVG